MRIHCSVVKTDATRINGTTANLPSTTAPGHLDPESISWSALKIKSKHVAEIRGHSTVTRRQDLASLGELNREELVRAEGGRSERKPSIVASARRRQKRHGSETYQYTAQTDSVLVDNAAAYPRAQI